MFKLWNIPFSLRLLNSIHVQIGEYRAPQNGRFAVAWHLALQWSWHTKAKRRPAPSARTGERSKEFKRYASYSQLCRRYLFNFISVVFSYLEVSNNFSRAEDGCRISTRNRKPQLCQAVKPGPSPRVGRGGPSEMEIWQPAVAAGATILYDFTLFCSF